MSHSDGSIEGAGRDGPGVDARPALVSRIFQSEPKEAMLTLLRDEVDRTIRRTHVRAHLVVDLVEHRRRLLHGIEAVRSRAALDDLLSLPVGMPVGRADLDVALTDRLMRLADGIIEVGFGQITRRLARPVRVERVTVTASTWNDAAPVLDELAPFAQREVVVDDQVLADPFVELTADRFGVGLSAASGVRVCHAEPFITRRFTATGWLFEERCYQAWRDSLKPTSQAAVDPRAAGPVVG